MGEPDGERPQGGHGTTEGHDDPRVRAVLEVLAGDPPDAVASRWAVERVLLDRWSSAFVEAGIAQVTHRPVGDVARRRDRFLTAFMHGLRNPLAVAQMWAGLLRDLPGPDTAAVAEIVAHLQDALDKLAEQAVEVELLTAAMLGRIAMDATWVTVGELVAGIDPPPEVGGEGADVELRVDPRLFGRVLRDLCSVAGSGGPVVAPVAVRVEVETVPPWVEVRVIRDGDPLDPTALSAMFEPFDRDDAHERVTVGLYLARALTVVHGGTIGVEQDDRCTTFGLRIPDARLTAVPSWRPRDEESEMKFQLACGDVMPGCAQTFATDSEDALLGEVAEHAASAHGITEITPEVLAAVRGKVRTTET